jgi:TonB family protein
MTSTAKTAFAPADAAFHIDNAIVSRETPLKHRATLKLGLIARSSMRNRLRFWPDHSDYSLLTAIHKESAGEISVAPKSGKSLLQLASTLSAGGRASSTELALDLVLNEITSQVRSSVGATGVAIALTRSGELVCRAATGNAPDLGVHLNAQSGLSGICLQTGVVQRCDDTETDPRVDVAACRDLRIRSILMAPVIKTGEVVGLLEAFSADPGHFRERDAEILLSFCGLIVNTIDSIAEAERSSKAGVVQKASKAVGGTPSAGSAIRVSKSASLDRWTVFLTAAVIAAALFLGWMIGLADRHKVADRKAMRLDAKTRQTSQDHKIHNDAATAAVRETNASPPQTSPSLMPVTNLPESKNSREENADGGLVVFQNGQVIFREVPRKLRRPAENNTDFMSTGIIPAAKTEVLTPEAASRYVAYRVQPDYPELARKQHIQGAVLLKVLVGKDGGVQQVQSLSGDPKLAAAAADAVVQWKFKPLLRFDQPVEFKTQITVDFKLP